MNRLFSIGFGTAAAFRIILAVGFLAITALAHAAPAMKTLQGHVPSVVTKLTPSGVLSPANRLSLAIGLPLRDSSGLDDFLAEVYDPDSPRFHQYLTPEQFNERFGPTKADYEAVAVFARKHHLTITGTYDNGLLLDVNGSVADIEAAFHVTLLTYLHPSEQREFYAPDREPSVDADLPIADVSGLNNYILPHPKSLRSASDVKGARLQPYSGSGAGGAYIGSDFRAAYLLGVSLSGSGQMVGLLEFDGFYSDDISKYEVAAGLPQVPIQTVLLDGFDGVPTVGPDSGNEEVSLDIEMALCMAPGLAKIIVFETGPNGLPNDLLNRMAASNQVSQLSCSWGWGGGPTTTTDNIFKEMAAQGQSFFQASGDTDAFTSGATSSNGADNPMLNSTPSSCPYITVVGGTTLTTSGPGGAWVSESVWNWGLRNGRYVGSSGGVSSFYSIPSWQTGIDMTLNGGSTANRNIPDVALTADNVFVQYGNGNSGTVGGTSCAAPLWAGLCALMNQQSLAMGRPTVGFINPTVYALGKSTSYRSGFHDITTGNNTWASSSNNFYAVTGYDLCTGWGTPEGQSLINAIAGLPDALQVWPSNDFVSVGTPGGPFNLVSVSIQLTNSDTPPLPWSLSISSSLLQASSTNGVLPPHGTTNLVINLSAFASTLSVGTYPVDLKFTDQTSHVGQTLSFVLKVVQSLVQNGGFETGDFSAWTLSGNGVVQTPFGTTVYNAVEDLADYPLVVHSGKYGAFLGDNQVATLAQTLPTIAGENYLLSFWLDNPTNGTPQRFSVNWNGGGISNNLYSLSNPGAFLWTNLQFIVPANDFNTVLQFSAENDPSYFGLDDISLTHMPALKFLGPTKFGDALKLSWTAVTGLTYQVQYTTNLIQPDWHNWDKPVVATSSLVTITDSVASPQRFYRLLVWH